MGELHKGKDAGFRAPVPHLPLGQIAFDEILDVFQDHCFDGTNFHKTDKPRRPVLASDDRQYHVKTTFNEKEAPYSRTALQYLNRLMLGKVYGELPEKDPPTLTDRILNEIKDNPVESFEEAIKYAVFDVLTYFSNQYPNLMPALYYTLHGVGVQGIRAAIHYGASTIESSKEDGVSDIDKDVMNLEKSVFAKQNMNYFSGKTFEIQCTGEQVGRTIITQSQKAAVAIIEAKEDWRLNTYIGGDPIDIEIFDHIDDLFNQAHFNNRMSEYDSSRQK